MRSQIAIGKVIKTSSIVFDVRRVPDARFRPEFRNAGEDYLVWLEPASRGARFAFFELIEASYGKGVNVYCGADAGPPMHLSRLIDEMRYRKESWTEYALPPEVKQFVLGKERGLRPRIVREVAYRLRHGKIPPWRWIVDLFRADPLLSFAAFPTAIRFLLSRTR